jgi:hypothetical protein
MQYIRNNSSKLIFYHHNELISIDKGYHNPQPPGRCHSPCHLPFHCCSDTMPHEQ